MVAVLIWKSEETGKIYRSVHSFKIFRNFLTSVNAMKNFLFIFLCIFFAGHTTTLGAEIRTIEVDFAFTPPADQADQLLGYKLYKNGVQVCETTDPIASRITCDFSTDPGTFSFTLKAYYADNSESQASPNFLYNIEPIAPPADPQLQAIIEATQESGTVPFTVSFSGINSTGDIANYSWDFGDGATGTGSRINHNYSIPGTYPATLEITDQNGVTHQANTTITALSGTVPLQPPTAVISSSTGVGNAPFLVTFDASSSTTPNPPIVRYRWAFGDNSQDTGEMTSHLYTTPGTYHAELTVEDSSGLTDTTDIPIVISEQIQPQETPPPPITTVDFSMEAGEVNIDHKWFRVLFENTFSQPIVIAGPPTFIGKKPLSVRIRNIDQTGFEIRLQEWDYLNDIHVRETVSYLVMEEGAYTLDNGSRIEAGRFTGQKIFQQVALQQSYSATPIILTQVATEWDTDAVTGRVRNIGNASFDYRLQEQQKTLKSHAEEEVGYIAWEPGQGTFSGLLFEAKTTAKKVNQKWFDLNFLTEFQNLPYLFTGIQTSNERDTATMRCKKLTQGEVRIKIQEEKSKDSELRHKKEVVGYLVIGSTNE